MSRTEAFRRQRCLAGGETAGHAASSTLTGTASSVFRKLAGEDLRAGVAIDTTTPLADQPREHLPGLRAEPLIAASAWLLEAEELPVPPPVEPLAARIPACQLGAQQ